MRVLVAFGAFGLLVGCHSSGPGEASSKAKSDIDAVKGEWVIASFQGKSDEKGGVTIRDDKTFTFTAPHDGKVDKLEGTIEFSQTKYENTSTLTLEFQNPQMKSKDNPKGMMMKLLYNPQLDILYDMLTVVFSRPGKEADVRAEMEKLRAKSK